MSLSGYAGRFPRTMTAPQSFGGALRAIAELQHHLPAGTSAAIGVLALGAAILPGLSGLTQHVNTMAHEGAHAAMGLATGRTIGGVRLKRNGEGETKLSRPQGGGFILAATVGYLGPSVFGLGAAELIRVGHAIAVLWVAIAALAVLGLIAWRNAFSIVAVLVTGLLVYLVARYASIGAGVAVAYGIAWFLLLSGVTVVLAHGGKAGDATILRQRTHVPRGLWAGVWLAGSALALIAGAQLLI
jgi:Peptidase M50B-like